MAHQELVNFSLKVGSIDHRQLCGVWPSKTIYFHVAVSMYCAFFNCRGDSSCIFVFAKINMNSASILLIRRVFYFIF